jgi:acetylornithine deacetylase/succinyl-diaminopimelate desuccinylase family protein
LLIGDLLQTLESWRDEIIDFVQQLISVPTENPPGRAYRPAVDLIIRKLAELGLIATVIEVPHTGLPKTSSAVESTCEPRLCVLAYHGTGKPVLYFHGHYDVVPAATSSQFQPFIQRGNLFGRGSSDMKSGLAAMIYAVRAIRECGISLAGRIGLTIVPDEETGGALGSAFLAQAGLLGTDGIGMMTPEPTSGVIWNANRGAISLKVTVRGKPAHVGMHYQGINAFEGMLRVAGALEDLRGEVACRRTRYKITPEAATQSILMMGGRCEGGTNFNLVPGECSFTVDRRINPEEDLETERNRLLGVLEGLRENGVNLDFEIFQEGPSAGVAETDPVAQALAQSVAEVSGRQARFQLCPGLLETRYYVARQIPAFAYGPGLLGVSHGPKEFVKIKDIMQTAGIYALTAAKLLK